jgi:hypothetical protein
MNSYDPTCKKTLFLLVFRTNYHRYVHELASYTILEVSLSLSLYIYIWYYGVHTRVIIDYK